MHGGKPHSTQLTTHSQRSLFWTFEFPKNHPKTSTYLFLVIHPIWTLFHIVTINLASTKTYREFSYPRNKNTSTTGAQLGIQTLDGDIHHNGNVLQDTHDWDLETRYNCPLILLKWILNTIAMERQTLRVTRKADEKGLPKFGDQRVREYSFSFCKFIPKLFFGMEEQLLITVRRTCPEILLC